MRTTVDIDEDILRTAKGIARENEQTLGRVLSDLARKGLKPPIPEYTIRNGVALLPHRPGAEPLTTERVKELLELDD